MAEEANGIAAADIHGDDNTYGSMNPATGMSRAWESHFNAADSAVDAALNTDARFFIACGDLTRDGRPTPEVTLRLYETLLPLTKANIPCVLVGGNHERHGVSTRHRTVVEVVGEMLAQHGEVHVVERTPRLVRLSNGIQIAGLPWLSKSTVLAELGSPGEDALFGDRLVSQYMVDRIDQMCTEADTTAPLILAGHVTTEELRLDSIQHGHHRGSETDIAHLFAEPILPSTAITERPFAVAALGHIHAAQQIGTKAFYAGSTDRLTMTDADDEKSVTNIILNADNTLARLQRIPTRARHLHRINVADHDVDAQIAAFEPDSLIEVTLAPGEAMAPPEVLAAIKETGARVVKTWPTPVDRPRSVATALPENVGTAAAVKTWLQERKPADVDAEYVLQLAAALDEEITNR